jgi:hypothetical protein
MGLQRAGAHDDRAGAEVERPVTQVAITQVYRAVLEAVDQSVRGCGIHRRPNAFGHYGAFEVSRSWAIRPTWDPVLVSAAAVWLASARIPCEPKYLVPSEASFR